MQPTLPIQISQAKIAEFCQRHQIRRLSLFGSVLRDDFSPDSDVDVLVEFEPGSTPGFAIVTMQQELSHLLGDRTVDLRTPQELSRYIRDRVLSEALVQYVQD
ncbi:nucleotidyltransferase [Phormidesmis priestleyi ULC007]|uniref:Nucleotidyltransferase n=1 Tax=Phormidesmis priestleyi ULC007 TaxID=1920490 RepID=A0A2T1DDM3_9CYAN|nr:nucleotidyltransferase family protein [Phormidesmis priestleyi]PSB18610.1 nucleotidyltransferase [Phormidesmis priestleyi ULC007]PZO49742.1 MAG: nucleotidyltransferase [Phormidesmis priestleyi]